jgi:hypothetical protein
MTTARVRPIRVETQIGTILAAASAVDGGGTAK